MFKFIPDEETFYSFLSKRLETVDLYLNDINDILDKCLNITYKRFRYQQQKYYIDDDNNVLLITAHSSQMVMFLYELSRQAYLKSLSSNQIENNKYKLIADKLYYLKIADTSSNLIYDNNLPLKLSCDHPISAVIGRAIFTDSSSFKFSSNCSIGNNKGIYPTIDGDLLMLPNSCIVGDVKIEGLVVASNGCYIKDEGLIKDKLVFGRSPNLIFKDIKEEDKCKYLFYTNSWTC